MASPKNTGTPKDIGTKAHTGGTDTENVETIEMSLQELMEKLPCGLMINMDSEEEWAAYYFYAIAAKQVTETFTDFDLSYLTLDARVTVHMMVGAEGELPYFEVKTGEGTRQSFTVYGKGLGDKWNEMVSTDWSI